MNGPSPMIASQPKRTAASTATLTFAAPITERRYSSGWSKNASMHGIDTTRDEIPLPFRSCCAATASDTSDPEAKIDTAAEPSAGAIS